MAVIKKNVTVMEIAKKNSPLNLKWDAKEQQLKAYAQTNHVPIILDEGLAFLETLIRLHKPKKILEIGTAIGYSAIRMHRVCGSHITTIERDADMFHLATLNIQNFGYEKNIKLIFKDALECYETLKNETFDMIFIDAAKAQYTKFFNLYAPLLSSGGLIICDNMFFHGLVEEDSSNYSRSVRGLVRKLSSFHNFLLENEKYTTSIFNIGDGMAVSIKKY